MMKKCRIWWPKQIVSLSREPSSNSVLFGWFVSSSSGSLDVVVAFVSPVMSLLSIQSQLLAIPIQTKPDSNKFDIGSEQACESIGIGQVCSFSDRSLDLLLLLEAVTLDQFGSVQDFKTI